MDSEQQSSDASTKRFGRGMIVAFWILLLVLLTTLFQAYIDEQHNPNSNPQGRIDQGVREVVLERNRAGHYVANGSINGVRVTFLLDTGATDVAVPGALARKLGLPRGSTSTSRTANGMVTSWRTRLDEVTLGPVVLRGVSASILPSMQGMDVLLAMSFLKQLEMVQRGRHLTLRQFQSVN